MHCIIYTERVILRDLKFCWIQIWR